MDSKELEKVDLVVNQPVRSDILVIEDDVMPADKKDSKQLPVPYLPTGSKLSRGLGSFLAMAAMMSAVRGTVMGGFRPSQKIRKHSATPSGSRRKRLHARKIQRKAQELARRNNRGVKGCTQLHRHR